MIKNKTALITGSSSGIGKEIAIQLARQNIVVCINYSKSADDAKRVKKTIEKEGGKAVLFKADVSKEKNVERLFTLLKKSVRPRIINIASRFGTKPDNEIPAYCCAEAGVIMLTKVSALGLAKYGIKVNTISPSLTRTPLTEKMCSQEEFNSYAENNPSKRVGLPKDIANAVLFLISDKADFINGENINVSGGILLK